MVKRVHDYVVLWELYCGLRCLLNAWGPGADVQASREPLQLWVADVATGQARQLIDGPELYICRVSKPQ